MGIRAFVSYYQISPHVAIFDTAFHQTMPEKAYLYSLPYHYYKDYGIRKYGFHGTSHKFVSQRAAEMLDKTIEDLHVLFHVTLVMEHQLQLSMAVNLLIHQWASHHLVGVTMGTRSGNIDPALIPFIMEKQVKLLNKYWKS